MEKIELFPTTIGYFFDKEFTDKLLPIVKEYLGNLNQEEYRWGYKITYDSKQPINTDPKLSFLREKILEMCNEYCKLTLKHCPPLGINIWFSEMTNGNTHKKHCHTNSVFSGIFYLAVPENSSPIIFYDPRQHYNYVNIETIVDTSQYTIEPKEGLIMVWPSWFEHEVPVNENLTEPRITAVFDVYIKTN